MIEQLPEAGESAGAPALAASFRDPSGSLVCFDGRIIRIVNRDGVADLRAFLESNASRKLIDSGQVVRTDVLDESEVRELRSAPAMSVIFERAGGEIVLEHERIAFPSYPYEWPPEMLHAAGKLTVDLALSLLGEGIGIKDGTPYNVLFRGPEPVFIDVLSFERRDPADPTWLPYAQFVRTFLLPLLANKHFGVPLAQVFTTRRDGLEPEEVYRWVSSFQRIRPPFLGLVSMPVWLGSKHDQDDTKIYRKRSAGNPEKARFILETLLKGLRCTLNRVAPPQGRSSVWSGYMESSGNNYTREHFLAKQAFVQDTLAEFAPKRVLDVGCNTGHFSALAARAGSKVVAIDYDPVVAGQVWRAARAEKLDIQPLVVNLTRPSPGVGWRNQECPSFLDRARGKFDLVLMLAVIHHMLVTERVPLTDILSAAGELTADLAVIEFIGPEDSMFRRLTRGREELHKDLSTAMFESAATRTFEIVRRQHLEGTSRWLYLLRKRA